MKRETPGEPIPTVDCTDEWNDLLRHWDEMLQRWSSDATPRSPNAPPAIGIAPAAQRLCGSRGRLPSACQSAARHTVNMVFTAH